LVKEQTTYKSPHHHFIWSAAIASSSRCNRLGHRHGDQFAHNSALQSVLRALENICGLRFSADLLQLGWPAASQVVFEVGAFSLATLMAGQLSPDILAAHQIVLNSASLTYMVPLGVSAAAAISVGQAIGAGDRARARRNGSMAITIGAAFMALAATAFLTFPQTIARDTVPGIIIHSPKSSRPRTSFWATFSRPYGT
jgi:hypothetical protein